jgi:carbonic anhydrase
MLTFSTPELRTLVKDSEASSPEVDSIDFHEFANVEDAVKDDVQWLKDNKLILPETIITGWVYEVETGKAGRSAEDNWGLRVSHDVYRSARSCKLLKTAAKFNAVL